MAIDLGVIFASVRIQMGELFRDGETVKSSLADVQASMAEVTGAAAETEGGMATLAGSLANAAVASDELGQLNQRTLEILIKYGQATGVATDATTQFDESLQATVTASDEASGATDTLATALDAVIVGMEELAVAVDGAATSLQGEAVAADEAAVATESAGNAAATAAPQAEAAAFSFSNIAESAKKAIMPLTLAAALLLGVGVVAVKMAGDFQSGITSLVTGAGESQQNIQLVSDGIMNLSTAVGTSTSQLIAGAYMIESSGEHGRRALDTLTAAAEGAKVGSADLGVVADGATTILNDFGGSGLTAANSVNYLIATVANGKTHMEDLSKALAQILPTASAANIGLKDVMGAMATMTGEGVPAANAATYLRQTIIALEAPSKQTKDALKSIGLSATDVALAMRKSLPDTLQMITDALAKKFPAAAAATRDEMIKVKLGQETMDEAMMNLANNTSPAYVAALKSIAGGSKQMQGMLDLTGIHMDTFKNNVTAISDAVTQGGDSVTGWNLVQQDFNTKMAQAGAEAQVAFINLGKALAPVAISLADSIMPKVQAFSSWVETHGPEAQTIFEALAVAIGVGLVVALGVATAGFIYMNAASLGITAAIGLVAMGVMMLITHWNDLHGSLGAVKPIIEGVGSAFHPLGDALGRVWADMQPMLPALKLIGELLGGLLIILVLVAAEMINGFVGAVTIVIDVITMMVRAVMNAGNVFDDLIHGNFKKAAADSKTLGDQMSADWGHTWNDIQISAANGSKMASDVMSTMMQQGADKTVAINKDKNATLSAQDIAAKQDAINTASDKRDALLKLASQTNDASKKADLQAQADKLTAQINADTDTLNQAKYHNAVMQDNQVSAAQAQLDILIKQKAEEERIIKTSGDSEAIAQAQADLKVTNAKIATTSAQVAAEQKKNSTLLTDAEAATARKVANEQNETNQITAEYQRRNKNAAAEQLAGAQQRLLISQREQAGLLADMRTTTDAQQKLADAKQLALLHSQDVGDQAIVDAANAAQQKQTDAANKAAQDAKKAAQQSSDDQTKVARNTVHNVTDAAQQARDAIVKNATVAADATSAQALKAAQGTLKGYSLADKNASDATHQLAVDAAYNLQHAGDDANIWGYHAGANFAAGLTSSMDLVLSAGLGIADSVHRVLAHSKPREGPLSEGEEIWGRHIGENLIMGLEAIHPAIKSTIGEIAQSFTVLKGDGGHLAFGVAGASGVGSASGVSAGGRHFHGDINLTIEVAADAGDNADPQTAGEQFGRGLGLQLAAVLDQRGHG